MITNMKVTPESRGISSRALLRFIKRLDSKGVPMHAFLIARGEDILLDAYWAPFSREKLHRTNSVTKSFVALAIGLLIEEGRVRLNDKIIDYFPEAKDYDVTPEVAEQTVYDLLTMRTTYFDQRKHWVRYKLYDRIKNFFTAKAFKEKQTLFYYDSCGSYMLGVIVERLVGKPFMEYLKEKILLKIGFSANATCISDPAGYSWSDSGLLCTPEDLYRVGKFIADGGVWDGERLMDAEFLRAATSAIGSNCGDGNDRADNTHGYGYQIWHEMLGGFGFHGMGMQYLHAFPTLDLYFACNADTQGNDKARTIYMTYLEDFVLEEVSDTPLPEDPEGYAELCEYCKKLELISLIGEKTTETADKISGRKIVLKENPMNIKWMRFELSEDGGCLYYENLQGEKALPFGMCRNEHTVFPEDGYAYMRVGESPEGYHHPCAVSAAWQDKTTLAIKAQMTGYHLGGLYITVGFDGDRAAVRMVKNTNCFLNEYEGFAIGRIE